MGAFPLDQGEFTRLDDSIQHLVTNDRSVTLAKEASEALGQGWRLGFLGKLPVHKQGLKDVLTLCSRNASCVGL